MATMSTLLGVLTSKMDQASVLLTSLNESKVKSLELTASTPELTIGRAADNMVVIPDQRCSSKHCKLTLVISADGEPELHVEDLSSNGTYANGKRIGKNVKAMLQNGDTLSILKGQGIPEAEYIEFKVTMRTAKRKRDTPPESPTKKAKLSSELSEELRCGICIDVIHQCVTLMPCLHNFCGGCFSDWLGKSKLCPACRDPVCEARRNPALSNIIETYLKSHPEEMRTPEELKELEQKNKITVDTLTIQARKKSFDSAGSASSSDSSSEEEVKAPRARGRIAIARARPSAVSRASAAATPRTTASPIANTKCRQCTRKVQDYKCGPAQQHILCVTCHQPMPLRPTSVQTCDGCQRHFCNQYWRTAPRCNVGLSQLDSYRTTTFSSMPPTALNENQFEQNVLLDFMRSQTIRFNDVIDTVLADMTANRWTPHLYTRNVSLNAQSQICTGCAALLWNEMIYHYRDVVTARLPAYISGRPSCWYGKDCKTQKHNISHAQKLNHICAPDTSRARR
mmetsp:Transcript_15831/g.28978  ORF Transcript_15831/g.28978 Transcript_15831/m.28978 type:complete len:511 (+) Transcript_15831:3396-4928(+)